MGFWFCTNFHINIHDNLSSMNLLPISLYKYLFKRKRKKNEWSEWSRLSIVWWKIFVDIPYHAYCILYAYMMHSNFCSLSTKIYGQSLVLPTNIDAFLLFLNQTSSRTDFWLIILLFFFLSPFRKGLHLKKKKPKRKPKQPDQWSWTYHGKSWLLFLW